MIDRFRALPMTRSAVLAGRTIADAVRNLFVLSLTVAVGTLVGFRFHTGPGAALAIGLALAIGVAFSWIFALLGLLVRDPESRRSRAHLLSPTSPNRSPSPCWTSRPKTSTVSSAAPRAAICFRRARRRPCRRPLRSTHPGAPNWSTWALRQGGVRVYGTNISFIVAASGSDSVRVNTVRLNVEPLRNKAIGDVISCAQGGPIPVSVLSLDLDHQRASYMYPDLGPQAGQSRRFSLEIAAGHAEHITVEARAKTCFCSWYLELLIEVKGTQYTYRVDSDGKPFVTAPSEGDYAYFNYDPATLRWKPTG